MDAVDFAGFWLRHQRIGTRSTSNLFPARALESIFLNKWRARRRRKRASALATPQYYFLASLYG
jgi:hypothetical protein